MFVVQGEVGICLEPNETEFFQKVGINEVFGDKWTSDLKAPRFITAKATKVTHCMRISRHDFLENVF